MKTFCRISLFAVVMMFLYVCGARAQSTKVKHIVNHGETITSIAKHYSTTDAKIIKYNPAAEDSVYIGMELLIPVIAVEVEIEDEVVLQQPVVNNATQVTTQQTKQKSSRSDSDLYENNINFWEIVYSVVEDDLIKPSGSYGIGWTMLPWELTSKFSIGFHFSPLNINHGLVNRNHARNNAKVGPAVGYYITEHITLLLPLDVVCSIPFDGGDVNWGMQLSPAFCIGKRAGIFFGPQISFNFSESCLIFKGFRAGIYF